MLSDEMPQFTPINQGTLLENAPLVSDQPHNGSTAVACPPSIKSKDKEELAAFRSDRR